MVLSTPSLLRLMSCWCDSSCKSGVSYDSNGSHCYYGDNLFVVVVIMVGVVLAMVYIMVVVASDFCCYGVCCFVVRVLMVVVVRVVVVRVVVVRVVAVRVVVVRAVVVSPCQYGLSKSLISKGGKNPCSIKINVLATF